MRLNNSPDPVIRLGTALRHMTDALFILDELRVPSEISLELEFAIGRLSRELKQGPNDRESVHRMLTMLEQEFVAHRTSGQQNP